MNTQTEDRHIHRHTDRQTDRQTDRHRQTHTHLVDKISLHNPNPVALKGITAEGHDAHSTVVHGEHSCRAGQGREINSCEGAGNTSEVHTSCD